MLPMFISMLFGGKKLNSFYFTKMTVMDELFRTLNIHSYHSMKLSGDIRPEAAWILALTQTTFFLTDPHRKYLQTTK